MLFSGLLGGENKFRAYSSLLQQTSAKPHSNKKENFDIEGRYGTNTSSIKNKSGL